MHLELAPADTTSLQSVTTEGCAYSVRVKRVINSNVLYFGNHFDQTHLEETANALVTGKFYYYTPHLCLVVIAVTEHDRVCIVDTAYVKEFSDWFKSLPVHCTCTCCKRSILYIRFAVSGDVVYYANQFNPEHFSHIVTLQRETTTHFYYHTPQLKLKVLLTGNTVPLGVVSVADRKYSERFEEWFMSLFMLNT